MKREKLGGLASTMAVEAHMRRRRCGVGPGMGLKNVGQAFGVCTVPVSVVSRVGGLPHPVSWFKTMVCAVAIILVPHALACAMQVLPEVVEDDGVFRQCLVDGGSSVWDA